MQLCANSIERNSLWYYFHTFIWICWWLFWVFTSSNPKHEWCLPSFSSSFWFTVHLFLLQMLLVGNSFKITGFVLNVQYTDKSLIRWIDRSVHHHQMLSLAEVWIRNTCSSHAKSIQVCHKNQKYAQSQVAKTGLVQKTSNSKIFSSGRMLHIMKWFKRWRLKHLLGAKKYVIINRQFEVARC